MTAAASYHLMEMPIRNGRISKVLTRPKTLVSGALAMLLVAGGATALGGTPVSAWLRSGTSTTADRDRSIIMLVGDSVPKRILPVLAPTAEERGLTVVSAAQGSCTALTVPMELHDGTENGKLCGNVGETQTEALKQYQPGVIVWWSRYEIADRYDGERLLSPDMDAFWVAQQRDFNKAIDRLTADGAIVVLVKTERPGIGLQQRCTPDECPPFLKRMIEGDQYRVKFNEMIDQKARTDDRVRVIETDPLFCPPGPSKGPGPLCDDTVGGHLMRPDGAHLDNDRFGTEVSNELLNRIEAVIG